MFSKDQTILAVIPARGGSKGLAGKSLRPLCGLPLIGHSIRLAQMCPEITRTIVSTDSTEIADVARQLGGDVPFQRPDNLAQDHTPMWPVLQHALQTMEHLDGKNYDILLLLDPTAPCRLPEDVSRALAKFIEAPNADGVVGVSEPEFNPIWHCVIERDGWMADLFPEGANFTRRQDLPSVYRINSSIYAWRASFVRRSSGNWRAEGKHLLYAVPEARSLHIDTLEQFERATLLIRQGIIKLPWIDPNQP